MVDLQVVQVDSFPLGSNYENGVQIIKNNDLAKRRVARYALQAAIGDILPNERVARCMRLIVPGKEKVSVLYSPKIERAHYGNLTVCGSVWSCPICAAKITERRRLELSGALSTWSGSVFMAAFTLQHNLDERLQDVQAALLSAFRKLTSGRDWQEIKKQFGIVGSITALEVTWSNFNGWHPHKHVLYFSEKQLTSEDIRKAEIVISERFSEIVKKLGGYSSPEFGVKLSLGFDNQETKNYCFKWGVDYEITKSPVKKAIEGFSPFELANWAASTGEAQPVYLFREYYRVFKGKHQLTYSKGLRALLGLDQEQQTDLELAELQEQDAYIMAEIGRVAWKVICIKRMRGELLEVASSGLFDNLERFLNDLGIYALAEHEGENFTFT